MTGKLITVTHHDSVRVVVLGGGRAVTLPAELILAADRVMRETLMKGDRFVIVYGGIVNGKDYWTASLDDRDKKCTGETPWQAVLALAKEIEK